MLIGTAEAVPLSKTDYQLADGLKPVPFKTGYQTQRLRMKRTVATTMAQKIGFW